MSFSAFWQENSILLFPKANLVIEEALAFGTL